MGFYVDEKIKNTFRTPIEQGRRGYVRLDMNENPEGLPKAFFKSVMKEITPEYLATYPEDGQFIKKYAKYLGITPGQLTPVDGSTVAIQYVERVLGEPGKEVVVVTPSFGMYYVNANLLGLKSVSVKYEPDYSFRLENILNAIGPETTMVVLVNPNMPVGNVYSPDEIRSVILQARKFGASVLIDEAYFYFYDKSSIPFIDEFDNVVILRTFSKMLSIPALRLGAIISNKEIIRCINNYKSHFTVNGIALLFGERIIDNADTLIPLLEKKQLEGRAYVVNDLRKHGYTLLPVNGNFVCIKPLHRTTEYIVDELKKQNILIHSADQGFLAGFIRVTTANKPIMKQFLSAFYSIDK